MNSEIELYVDELVKVYPNISSIWLIGSRATDTANSISDWDLLVFGNQNIFNSLKENKYFHKGCVDLLVVLNENGDFEKPWGENKRGNLETWEWNEEDDYTASYKSVKFVPDAPGSKTGDMQIERLKAIKIYPRKCRYNN